MSAVTPSRAQVRRVVAGAVRDTFNMHPGYLTKVGHKRAYDSLVKRVAGTVSSYVEQSTWGRPDFGQSAHRGIDAVNVDGCRSPTPCREHGTAAPGEIPAGDA